MKPTSIVSLVIAVLLVIIGLVTCFIAQNMAQENGEFLFAEERNDDLVQTVDLTDSEISKIELIVGDAEINIIGQSEKSYIEFINFRENYYALSATNRVLSFDEIPDIMSMLKFWENGFSFKGMRYILNFNNEPQEERPKVINIYLDSQREIKIFDITADNCTLNITSMTTPTDYNIIAANALINGQKFRTTSTFNVNVGDKTKPGEKLVLNLDTALLTNMNIHAVDLQMKTTQFRCSGSANIVCDTGFVDISSMRKISDLYLNVTSSSGQITVDGKPAESPYMNLAADDPTKLIKIQTGSADVTLSNNSASADTEMTPNS